MGGFVHFAAHCLTAAVLLWAGVANTTVMRKLFRVRLLWVVCCAGYCASAAITQLALALKASGWLLAANDYLQLALITGFVATLLLDSHRLVLRLSNALEAIKLEYDGLPVVRGERGRALVERGDAEKLTVGSAVLATINFALHGKGRFPRSEEDSS